MSAGLGRAWSSTGTASWLTSTGCVVGRAEGGLGQGRWHRLEGTRSCPTCLPCFVRRHDGLPAPQTNPLLSSLLVWRQDDNVLLMDRFPTADEIVQLPCLPLTLAPLPPALTAAAAAAVPGGGEAAAQRTPSRQPLPLELVV